MNPNSQSSYLREQATIAFQSAASASLQNVRARFVESAAAWTQLAERAEKVEVYRALPIEGDW
ncbi:MAG: hypothetical protein JWO25_3902 [Alphaproteobacteria bacterium]|nr:hypothetical protein [Alphaproteobacteria bacterium]